MFPERQLGPHRGWNEEIKFLDNLFHNGSAYTVGKVNGDHWLLYITGPEESYTRLKTPATTLPHIGNERSHFTDTVGQMSSQDYTIEILMSDLATEARQPFFSLDLGNSASSNAQELSSTLGICDLFPAHLTSLDAYSFSPCGYSANAIITLDNDAGNGSLHHTGEGYFTIHVTPEEGSSYASFECNVPLPTRPSRLANTIPDLRTLIRRVVRIFQPGRLSLTLFVSSEDRNIGEDEVGENAIDAAQRAFKSALTSSPHAADGPQVSRITDRGGRLYKRTDKINYEFRGYELAFASFEICS